MKLYKGAKAPLHAVRLQTVSRLLKKYQRSINLQNHIYILIMQSNYKNNLLLPL